MNLDNLVVLIVSFAISFTIGIAIGNAKRKKKCHHQFEIIGYFYKEHLTRYENGFDEVMAYKRLKCKKCGEVSTVLLSVESFMPQLYRVREKRKDDYIQNLINMGFRQEVELEK